MLLFESFHRCYSHAMRFAPDGPSIPDELLNARDEGRVVFFCGAGVSRARADLPDFFGLAEKVIQELGVREDSTIRKVLHKAREIGDEVGVPGLISADRVFGLLEREFDKQFIRSAVARSLTPQPDVDVSAHLILLRLATTPSSKTQLVTTNFDRLFEVGERKLKIHQPPRLPNPSRYNDLDGLVYLHGRVNKDYTEADGADFVLSSSEFGYAYLSEGWAAEFFRDIVRTYVVVFVGYAADDPPLQYLLEGFQRTPHPSRRIFAFQAEGSEETAARWRDKGVEAISYAQADKHRALWETLELWAQRADNPPAWHQSVLRLALKGPEQLKPHERGQVAHLVSTSEGAREFAELNPPAEWLCVFDPSCRYSRPGTSKPYEPEAPTVDPFLLYGLDWDAVPQRGDPHRPSATRDIPADAWDAFIANSLDRVNLSDDHFAALRAYNATQVPRLPRRLEYLSWWLQNVANQPTAVWWAVRQQRLHAGLQKGIAWSLDRHHQQTEPVLRIAWQYLLEAWKRNEDANSQWYNLKREIERSGWGPATARALGELTCPYVKASRAFMSSPVPPKKGETLRLGELLHLEVECPGIPPDADIPNEWLEHVLRGFRKNIELAVRLCEEVNDPDRFHISPITRDESPGISGFRRIQGLSGCVVQFAALFERLLGIDRSKAKREFLAWPQDDDTAFSRLRFWAAGKSELVTPNVFCDVVNGLSNKAFWSLDHQRDLLLVLAERWGALPKGRRKRIERRLLEGPPRWHDEEETGYEQRKARSILDRLQWLADRGCSFSGDVEKKILELRESDRSWKPEDAKRAAGSRETRGGFVATITEHSALLSEPIESVLTKARELSGRAEGNFFEERDPFAGLCADHPVRAYDALLHAARKDDFPEWAWNTFLTSKARENDQPQFSEGIASELCQFPDAALSKLLYPSAQWLQKTAKVLSRHDPNAFDKITARLIDAAGSEPSGAESAPNDVPIGRDWGTAALNSSVGQIAMAILQDDCFEHLAADIAASVKCLARLERLLDLTGDPRRHAIAIISHDLDRLDQLASSWTERHLLSIIGLDDLDDRAAFWAGFFWNTRLSSVDLYLRLKPALLALVKERDSSSEAYMQSLAYLICVGWAVTPKSDGTRAVSNAEFREVLLSAGDEFRNHVLWQIERTLAGVESSSFEEWVGRSQEFFLQVWPRQKSVKTPRMSIGLVRLLASNVDAFPRMASAIMPLLTKIEQGDSLHFDPEIDQVVKNHPEPFLGMLHTILPDDVSKWPYNSGEFLDQIGEADSKLLSDTRL
jgi:SIR2-like domain